MYLQSLEYIHARLAVAANPDTRPDTLEYLSRDECSAAIRVAVAANPSTPAATLDRLSRDEYPLVREHVATNPSAPPDTIARLVDDADMVVRAVARENRAPTYAVACTAPLNRAPTPTHPRTKL